MRKILSYIMIIILGLFLLSPISIEAATYSNISEGTYIFRTSLNKDMVMDISNGIYENGTNIQIYNYNGTDSQKFDVCFVKSGWYKIALVESNKVIDVSGGVKSSGVNVQLYDYNASDAQLWRFYDAGNGYYYIKNKLGYYLDVSGGISENGTNVQVYEKNNTDAQKWKLSRITGSECKIATALNTEMVLDVFGNNTDNGTNIQIYNDHAQNNQRFYIVHYKSGWYVIISKHSGKAIDVTNGKSESGVNVQLYDLNWTDAQLWRFINAGNGYYYIQNKLGYYLDVSGGISKNETNVQVYEKNNTDAQKWKITMEDKQYYHADSDSYFTETKTLSFNDFDSWKKAVIAAETTVANITPTMGGSYNAAPFIVDKQVLEWKTIQAEISLSTPGGYKTIYIDLPSKILYTYHKHKFEEGITNYGKTWYYKGDSIAVVQTCECGYRTEWLWEIPLEDFSSKANVSPKQQVIWQPRFWQ